MRALKQIHKTQKMMTGKALAIILSFALVSSLSAWPMLAFANPADENTEQPVATEQSATAEQPKQPAAEEPAATEKTSTTEQLVVTEKTAAEKPAPAADDEKKTEDPEPNEAAQDVEIEQEETTIMTASNDLQTYDLATLSSESITTKSDSKDGAYVYVYTRVGGNNTSGLEQNTDYGGWYTLGALWVEGLETADSANKSNTVQKRTYIQSGDQWNKVLAALGNLENNFERYSKNQSIDLSKVSWEEPQGKTGLKLEFGATDFLNGTPASWHLDGWVEMKSVGAVTYQYYDIEDINKQDAKQIQPEQTFVGEDGENPVSTEAIVNISGYKYNRASSNLETLTFKAGEEQVVKLYYSKDMNQISNLSYTVKHVVDGDPKATFNGKKEGVWVNAPQTLELDADHVADQNYDGYKIKSIKLSDGTDVKAGDQIANGSIVTVTYAADFASLDASGINKVYDAQKSTIDVRGMLVGDTAEFFVENSDGTLVRVNNSFINVNQSGTVIVKVKRGSESWRKDVEVNITPTPVSVIAQSATKQAGEADPQFKADVIGTFGDDHVDYVIEREAGEEAGSYALTPTGEEKQDNYAVTYVPATLTITTVPAPTPEPTTPTNPVDPSDDPVSPTDPTNPSDPADEPTDPGVDPTTPTTPVTPVVPTTPTAGTTPAVPATPATPATPVTPAAGTIPAVPATPTDGAVTPVVAAPAADGTVIADDATPLAAADEATIADDANPLAAPEAPQCWVHILMIIGIILTAIYGAAIVLRRLGYARKVDELDQDITGTKPPVKPAPRVQRVMQHA